MSTSLAACGGSHLPGASELLSLLIAHGPKVGEWWAFRVLPTRCSQSARQADTAGVEIPSPDLSPRVEWLFFGKGWGAGLMRHLDRFLCAVLLRGPLAQAVCISVMGNEAHSQSHLQLKMRNQTKSLAWVLCSHIFRWERTEDFR